MASTGILSANSCNFNGQTIASGATVTAYSAATVPYGSLCSSVAETVTCTNGTLSPANAFASCSVTAAASCTFNGQTVASGSAIGGYTAPTVPFGSSCSSVAIAVLCVSGVLNPSNAYATCSVSAQPSPTPTPTPSPTPSPVIDPTLGFSYGAKSFVTKVDQQIALIPVTSATIVSYSVTPTLPTGLSLNTSTGRIAGASPGTATNVSTNFKITGTGANGNIFNVYINIAIEQPGVIYSSNIYQANGLQLTVGKAMAPDDVLLNVATGPYSINPTYPLPPGLAINPTTGEISGTPTQPGSFTIGVYRAGSNLSYPVGYTISNCPVAHTLDTSGTCTAIANPIITCSGIATAPLPLVWVDSTHTQTIPYFAAAPYGDPISAIPAAALTELGQLSNGNYRTYRADTAQVANYPAAGSVCDINKTISLYIPPTAQLTAVTAPGNPNIVNPQNYSMFTSQPTFFCWCHY